MGARSKPSPRTLVIGDVHGCLDELLALITKAGITAGDRVVLVGDLVAKGPDSAGVVAWARESGAAAVLGNHDDHILRAREGSPDAKPHHLRVAKTLSEADADWLAARPLWLRLALEDPHVVVHGGMVPGVPVEKQEREHLLAMRSVRADGTPSKRIEGAPWASLWKGPEHAVFGHDAIRGLQQHAHATGLDTGCVYGRELTGLLLPAHELVSVVARREYAPMK
ncbi:MAG TPA: metallophosphoesterase [Polyangia bacterium]|nr:metallophosphoesterase [Polyangia bacterium]